MDLLKRLFCIVLALTMALCLVACGSSEEEDEGSRRDKNKETTVETTEETTAPKTETEIMVGEWEAEIDMTDYMSDKLYESMGLDIDVEDYKVTLTIEFNEDGTHEGDLDVSKAEAAAEAIIDQMWPMLVEMYAKQYGMTYEQMERGLASEGVTKDSLVAEMDMQAEIDTAFEVFIEGKWLVEEGELCMAKRKPENADAMEIEFDGEDSFTIVGDYMTENDDLNEYILPLTFNRV